MEVVKERCEEIGRDPATLETSMLVIVDHRRERRPPDMIPDDYRQHVVVGSADQIADQIKTKVLDAGIDGVILSPITNINGYHPGGITAVAEKLKPLARGLNLPLRVANLTDVVHSGRDAGDYRRRCTNDVKTFIAGAGHEPPRSHRRRPAQRRHHRFRVRRT